ncbi:MAG: GWxTD domain-containing protein [Bacteroidota bacterium]
MKKVAFLFLILSSTILFGQEGKKTSPPGLFMDVCRFNLPMLESGNGLNNLSGAPFVEIHLAVAGSSLMFQAEAADIFQANVGIDIQLYRLEGTDTVLVDKDKYTLRLPPERRLTDTTLNSKQKANLLNVHTLRLEPGTYLARSYAVDNNNSDLPQAKAEAEFMVDRLKSDNMSFSDIKWSAGEMPRIGNKKGKGGREEIIPMVTNSTFFNEDTLSFYQEIYNSKDLFDDKFFIRSAIYQGSDNNRLWNYQTVEQTRDPLIINVYKGSIPIANLPSNIYYLQVECFDPKKGIMKTHKQKFYVYNSRLEGDYGADVFSENSEMDIFNKYTEEELEYFLRTLEYRVQNEERGAIRLLDNYDKKRNYLYRYFGMRKKKGYTITQMWNGYIQALEYVNNNFKSTIKEGYQTDRGRVLLTYGIPNHKDVHPREAGLLPYEIWRYNNLGPQSNVIFVFFDPDLATNEFPLLHSNKYGEINNPRWRTILNNQNKGQAAGIIDYETDELRYNTNLDLDDN